MLTETLLKQPGFLYKIGQKHYYLGKWICKECTESDATDCVMMYHMCRNNHEEPDTNMYFQKLRAFSDFALEVPCNPAKTKRRPYRTGKWSLCRRSHKTSRTGCIL